MTDYEPTDDDGSTTNRDPAAIAKRVTRALDSFFHVKATSDSGQYHVHSGSGNTYTVTMAEGTCTCPDGQRGPWCKHAYRVVFQTGDTPTVEGVPDRSDGSDDHHNDDPREDTDDEDDRDTLTARVEHYGQNHPDASAIEAIAHLGIDPDHRECVEEVLA